MTSGLTVRVPNPSESVVDEVDQFLRAVADRDPRIEYDGTGSDGKSVDFYLYAGQAEPLIAAVLEHVWPAETLAEVVVRDFGDRSTTEFRVRLAGKRKGTQTPAKVRRSRLAAGDWFLVPIDDSFVTARITRIGKYQLLFYAFGQRRPAAPTESELRTMASLGPSDAIAHVLYAHHDLERGKWPWLGQAGPFNADQWPLPEFEYVFPPKDRHYARSFPHGLDSRHESREIPRSDWWQRSPHSVWSRQELDLILRRALDDPVNRYVMPPPPE